MRRVVVPQKKAYAESPRQPAYAFHLASAEHAGTRSARNPEGDPEPRSGIRHVMRRGRWGAGLVLHAVRASIRHVWKGEMPPWRDRSRILRCPVATHEMCMTTRRSGVMTNSRTYAPRRERQRLRQPRTRDRTQRGSRPIESGDAFDTGECSWSHSLSPEWVVNAFDRAQRAYTKHVQTMSSFILLWAAYRKPPRVVFKASDGCLNVCCRIMAHC